MSNSNNSNTCSSTCCKIIFLLLPLFLVPSGASGETLVKSSIDAKYKLSQFQRRNKKYSESENANFYRKSLSKILFSECRMFPNDSFNFQLVRQSCGPFPAMVSSMDRFYLEPDAPKLDLPMLWNKKRMVFLDMPNACF